MQPCQKRLDAECWRHNPKWAKKAFAYRLLHLLTPKQLTRRLPQGLRLALIAPGVDIPPGLVLPDGTVVGPGTILPPAWNPGDPVPPGIVIVPGTTFPSGWTPEDPPPEGVTLDPGAEFPPGWNPPDPVPEGLYPAPVLPPAAVATGPTPPTYVAPGTPGPPTPPPATPPSGVSYWFLEPFDVSGANDWTIITADGGVLTVAAGILKMETPAGDGHCSYRRLTSDTWPTNFTIVFSFAFTKQGTEPGQHFRFRGRELNLYTYPDGDLWLESESGWVNAAVNGSIDTDFHTYKLVVLDTYCQVLYDDVEIIASCELPTTGAADHMYLTLGHNGQETEVQYEYCGVIEN